MIQPNRIVKYHKAESCINRANQAAAMTHNLAGAHSILIERAAIRLLHVYRSPVSALWFHVRFILWQYRLDASFRLRLFWYKQCRGLRGQELDAKMLDYLR